MKRLLAPAPPDWTGLTYDDALSVNEVDVDGVPFVAVYLDDDDPLDPAGWAAYAAGWVPPPPPEPLSSTDLDQIAAAIAAHPELSDPVKEALIAVIDVVQADVADRHAAAASAARGGGRP